jgi:hypothetical protein
VAQEFFCDWPDVAGAGYSGAARRYVQLSAARGDFIHHGGAPSSSAFNNERYNLFDKSLVLGGYNLFRHFLAATSTVSLRLVVFGGVRVPFGLRP